MRKNFKKQVVAVAMATTMAFSMVPMNTWHYRTLAAAQAEAESAGEQLWNSEDTTLTFKAGEDATWKDSVFASNDTENYPDGKTIEDVTTTNKVKVTAKVTLDGDVSELTGEETEPESGAYKAIQLASAIKVGDAWTYVKSADYPFLKAENFEDGVANVEFTYEVENPGALQEVIFQYNSNVYEGNIVISDVTLADASEKEQNTSEEVWDGGDASLTFKAGEDATWKDSVFASNDTENYPDGKTIEDVTTTNKVKVTAKVTIDGDASELTGEETEPESGAYKAIQLASAIKVGDEWTYVKSADYPFLKAENFEDGVANVEFTYEVENPGALQEVIFQYNSNAYDGNITISDLKVINVVEKQNATQEVLVWNDSKTEFKFATKEDATWKDKVFASNDTDTYPDGKTIEDVTTTSKVKMKAKVTLDGDTSELTGEETEPESGAYKAIQLASAIKVGDAWTYVKSADYPFLKAENFEDGVANVEFTYEVENPGALQEVIFQYNSNAYDGNISISDVEIYNIQEVTNSLPQKEPIVLDDFESATGNAGWVKETGWQYTNNVDIEVAELGGGKALKLGLDYTGMEGYNWSEAKVKKIMEDGIDVSAYNVLTYDLIYPEEFEGFKTKVFAKNSTSNKTIIDKEGIEDSTVYDAEKGLKKATVTVNFSPNSELLTELIIGTIGVNSSFVGDVYIDNVTLSQLDPSADYVDITAEVKEGSVAEIDEMVSEVSLANPNASDSTKALYSYLKNLDANDQVLFGHQNDTYKKVSTRNGVYSDTKDVTGSISGIVGMDTMDLTGSQIEETDADKAIEKCIKYAKEAAAEGAIITLSTHMPNMSSNTIVKNEDGTFDFTACNFAESKDLSNNCAQEVMPGGKYNAQFTAYLDIIAEYANGLGDVSVLFRPFHENDGGWFWWGSATTDKETYIAMYRYMVDYLTNEKGVNNFLYVYSPNGPVMDEDKYLDRYPGDAYVDILAFDYYDDYNSYPAEYSDAFFDNIKKSCETIKKLADKKGKVAAISETGVRVMKADGSDNEGLLIKNNPIKDQEWYSKLNQVAVDTGMPYFLLWSNFMDTNFYVPYKYDDTKGQELINEFINFYNEDSSIFADGVNFYGAAENKKVTNKVNTSANGYFLNTFSKETILEAKTVKAVVKNADEVQIVLKNKENDVEEAITATKKDDVYSADITDTVLSKLGKTDVGTVTIVADGKELVTLKNISFGKEKEKLPKDTVENFELYYGDNDALGGTFSENSAAGCSSTFTLDEENKANGSFGGSFNYALKTSGPEVWTGRMKGLDENDYSEYNALTMWVKPDGKGQKLVIQLVSNGEDFEAFLTDFTATTEAKKITIPFSALKGKNGGKFDASNITKFAVWCNSNPIGKAVDITSSIKFDDIKFTNVDEAELDLPEGEGKYVVSDLQKEQVITASDIVKTYGDESFAIGAKTDGNGALSYESSDEKVVKVDAKGNVTIVGAGEAVVTVKAAESANYKAATKEVKVTVKQKNQTIVASDILKVVGDAAFSLEAKSSGDTTLTYASSDEKVAKVDAKGNVTAVGAGTAIITVTAEESINYKKEVKNVTVTVHRKSQTITATDKVVDIDTEDFAIGATTDGDGTLTYSSDNENVVTVDAAGVVNVIGVGEANIKICASQTATCAGEVKTIKVTVNDVAEKVTAPSKIKLSSVKSKKSKTVTVKWKKDADAAGYIVQYSTSKKFKKSATKTVTIKKSNVTSKTIKKLKAGKKYYVRVRGYANDAGEKLTGKYSSIKSVVIKK